MKTQLADHPINTPSERSQHSPSSSENSLAVRTALQLKKILVPIDFSGCSKKALQYAVALAQDYQSSVVLIHIVQTGTASSQLLQERKMELETLSRQEVPKHVLLSTLVRVGEPLREIIDVARSEFADLLVVFHARARGFTRLLFEQCCGADCALRALSGAGRARPGA